jgi:hypothetical protein
MEKRLAQHNGPLAIPHINEGLTKKQIADLAARSVEHVLEEGHVFQVAEAISAMEEFVRNVRSDENFVQFLRDELMIHQGRLTTGSGARIEICEAAVNYDYSSNGEWRHLDDEIRILSERKKALEERLRKLRPGKMIVDPETGEVTEGPLKKSKSTYRVTLARK